MCLTWSGYPSNDDDDDDDCLNTQFFTTEFLQLKNIQSLELAKLMYQQCYSTLHQKFYASCSKLTEIYNNNTSTRIFTYFIPRIKISSVKLQFNSILFAIKVLPFEIAMDKVIAKWETAAKRYTLLHAQRQLCVVAVPLK